MLDYGYDVCSKLGEDKVNFYDTPKESKSGI